MSRPSDAIKQHASFVVQTKAGKGLFVKESHFEVGYTPAYCETAEEAITYAMKKRAEARNELAGEINQLASMLDKVLNA